MAAGMKSVEFRREREKSWRALDALVVQIETRGIASLSEAQLTRLPALHRAVVSSLSVARSISLDRNLIEYLEALTARSYFCVYGTRRHLRDALADFLLVRFPGLVRRFRWHLLVAAAFLGLGMAAGFALVRADEDLYYSLVSEDLAQGRNPSASTDYLRGVLYGGDEHGGEGVVKTKAAVASGQELRICYNRLTESDTQEQLAARFGVVAAAGPSVPT